jgi:hypothetical protein
VVVGQEVMRNCWSSPCRCSFGHYTTSYVSEPLLSRAGGPLVWSGVRVEDLSELLNWLLCRG